MQEPMEPPDVFDAHRKRGSTQDDFPIVCVDEPRLATGIQWFNPHPG
jgi:hypothetical protein